MADLPLPNAVSAFIAARVERFGSEAPEQLRWDVRFVEAFGALPLYRGWTETIGIRPDGELVRWSTEGDYPGVQPVEDRTWRVTALVRGSRQYPELQPLVPARGDGDVDCWCRAHPRFMSGELICNECGGIGWRPVSEPTQV